MYLINLYTLFIRIRVIRVISDARKRDERKRKKREIGLPIILDAFTLAKSKEKNKLIKISESDSRSNHEGKTLHCENEDIEI